MAKGFIPASWKTPVNVIINGVAVLATIISLAIAWSPLKANPYWGGTILTLWALVPPLYFWVEWNLFWVELDEAERERAKHNHELARNLWLGLIGVLSVSFGIKIL
jgi:hypothetical protein